MDSIQESNRILALRGSVLIHVNYENIYMNIRRIDPGFPAVQV